MPNTDTVLFIIRLSQEQPGKFSLYTIFLPINIFYSVDFSGSEFTVTNIDADELRKSQRKKKAPQILIQQPATYGSNDSDDDDDDVS